MQTLRDIIVRNEQFYPDVDAYVDGDRRLTHAQFAQRARQVASALHGLGVRHQGRVAIMSTNRLEYVELYGACEWAGFILANINFRLAGPEVAHVLGDGTPQVVVFEPAYLPLMEGLRSQFTGVKHWLCIDANGDAGWAGDYAVAMQSGDPAGPPCEVAPGDYVHLTYTSGTTGRSKGVASTHRRELRANEVNATEMEMRTNGCALITTPLFHVGAKMIRLSQAWRAGTCVLTGASFDPHKLLAIIEHERGEAMFLVADQIRQVLDALEERPYDLSCLRTIVAAGAPIPVPLLKRAIARLGRIIMVQFGMTEGCWTSLYKHELRPDGTPEDIARIGSVGHAMPQCELRVVDSNGRDCPPGVPGEVWGRSPMMLEVYWNNPDATAEALAGGWLHTGDIGYLDPQGFLYLVDRKKDMIISGGENIYCREVEEAIDAHDDAIESAVVARPDERWGEVVHAFVVLKANANVNADQLIDHCRERIARYKCPKSVSFVNVLPRLPTGKVNKVELRRLVREGGA